MSSYNYNAASYKGEGAISEWNEGNLKSMRLHEAQEMINFAKVNPLNKSPDGGNWNYELWIAGINVLYGEGCAKYADSEVNQVEKIRTLIVMREKYKPVHQSIKQDGMNSRNVIKAVVNYENWENLRKLIEVYEQKVKFFNDKHGLSTRNITSQGLF